MWNDLVYFFFLIIILQHLCPSRQGPNSARYRLIVEHFFAREQCVMTSKTADELSAIAIRR